MQALLAKLAVLVALLASLTHTTHTFKGMPVPLDCTVSYSKDIYDTPDGLLSSGYYDPLSGMDSTDATSGKPLIVANRTDVAYFEQCQDDKKAESSYPITKAQSDDFKASTAPLPPKTSP